MKLIKSWKKTHKMLSVQLDGLGSTLIITYLSMYDQIKETLPADKAIWAVAGLFIVKVLARNIDQGIEAGDKDADAK